MSRGSLRRSAERALSGTAFRWGLFPLAVFLLTFPLLAMHGLLRAIEGMTILILDLSTLLFFIGLVIGLWKESLRYKGPFVMDRTIALNRPVKKVFSVLLVIGLLALAPFLISYAATLILEDLTDLSISSPALEPAVRSFFDFYFPVGIGAAILSAVSAAFSLAWDWTLGGRDRIDSDPDHARPFRRLTKAAAPNRNFQARLPVMS